MSPLLETIPQIPLYLPPPVLAERGLQVLPYASALKADAVHSFCTVIV